MLKQHWIGLVFEAFVRVIAAARYGVASAQLCAVAAFVIACGAIHVTPASFESERDDLAGGASVASPLPGEVTAPADAFLETSPRRPARVSATAEQKNIARFLAGKYQLAIDRVLEFVELAYRAGKEVKVDPLLILAVASIESNFDPTAQSERGAQGLMQVLTRVHADKFAPFGGAAAAFDPLANMKVGAQILKDYLLRDGTIEAALKAYVGAATLTHDNGYGAKVLSERQLLADAAAGRPAAAAPATAPAAPGRSAEVRVDAIATPVLHTLDARPSQAAPEGRGTHAADARTAHGADARGHGADARGAHVPEVRAPQGTDARGAEARGGQGAAELRGIVPAGAEVPVAPVSADAVPPAEAFAPSAIRPTRDI